MAGRQEPFASDDKRSDVEAALRFPVGMASPLWFAFGAAAASASAWWWMTRWAREFALNAAGGAVAAGGMPTVPVEAATFAPEGQGLMGEPLADDTVQAAEVVAEAAGLVVDPMIEQPVVVAPEPTAPTAAAAEAVEQIAEKAADDLTRLVGVGPRLAAALAERGVTSFAQIADWNADQLSEMDKALNLRGRAVRDAWVSQAKRFASQP